MNYLKWNKWIFIILNLLWVVLTAPLFTYLIVVELSQFTRVNTLTLLFVYFLSVLQIVAFTQLRKGNIYPAILAIIALSLVIDLDGFKSINLLLINIELLYSANGDFIFDLNLQGPHSVINMRLSEFQFNQIGFNAIGLIQILLLFKQKTEINEAILEIEG